MSPEMCPRGGELFRAASEADMIFKSTLVRFFSNARKDEREMQQIEILGARHREADEAFQRHKKFCETCAGVSVLHSVAE
jgi:hypothetical protein